MLYSLRDKQPQLGKSVFVAPSASVIGDVQLGDHSSVWYGAVLRGDLEPIIVGAGTSVQDNCVLHTTFQGAPVLLGANVTLGHGCVVHSATVEDAALVGMNAVVLDGAVVEAGAVVAAGAVVRPGQRVPAGMLAAGNPAAIKRQLRPAERTAIAGIAERYREYGAWHEGVVAVE